MSNTLTPQHAQIPISSIPSHINESMNDDASGMIVSGIANIVSYVKSYLSYMHIFGNMNHLAVLLELYISYNYYEQLSYYTHT